ncbi:MAG: tail fiber domain-containing protein, partial [Alphaproteobacteria bacterium]|nr:tail fiber domain-containing protein [Alphaproteobacteria bacterium]
TDATASIQWCNGTAWADFGSGGGGAIDDLSDAFTDYVTEHNMILGGNPASANAALTAGARYNVFVGEGAGPVAANSTSAMDQNTAVGYQALTSLTSGGYNTAMGYSTLYDNTTGYQNTAMGYYALSSNTTGYRNAAMGVYALSSNTANYNTAMGYSALYSNTAGACNTAFGYNAGKAGTANTTGTYNTYIGYQAQTNANNYTNSTALGNAAIITSSNSITLGNNAIATIRAQVTTITGISDRRLKKDIVNLDLGLDFIEKLRPVSYRYNNGDETLRYGFIAQEVEKSLGKPAKGIALVVRGTDKKRTYAMGYSELIAPVVNAVQQLSAKFHVLEGKVRGLATEVKDLIVRFNPLEKEVANLKSEVKALKAANLRMQAQIDALVAKQK